MRINPMNETIGTDDDETSKRRHSTLSEMLIFRDSQVNRADDKDSFSFKQREDIILEDQDGEESNMNTQSLR